MNAVKEFRLPDVGEGLTEADIVAWHVKPGDTVKDGQVIVEIETAKAVVELPSPFSGTVASLLVDEGQTVDVGAPIITVDTSGGAAPAPVQPERAEPTRAEPAEEPTAQPAAEAGEKPAAVVAQASAEAGEGRQAVLVGYGVKQAATTRRTRKPTAGDTAAEASQAGGSGGLVSTPREITAKPPVRKLAKDLGISLAELSGSGPAGSITREDVQRAAGETTARSSEAGSARRDGKAANWPEPPAAAADERIPVRGVQKHMAAAMVSSAFTAPHVTEFLTVDVTETMAAVRRVRELPEFEGVRVSPLLFVARALLTAVARHPMINSSWQADTPEILIKRQVNLGIAVAAERGLIVPNIKDAGALTLPALARALHELTETARAGKATPADLAGGSITITNVGVFGVDAGTPILTPGEAAILAFGQVKDTPWVVDGQLAVRKACTLSLSFDHRIIDGELGSAALRDIGSMLEDPVRMLAWS
ncbi:MAG TPA: dihydrolipoamide acetyltransferase family protein [Streptosporangiaceae bacterium]